MKIFTVSAIVCAMVALTGAAALAETPMAKEDQADPRLVKRYWGACDSRWTKINGRCFQYVSKRMSWAKAQRHCMQLGGHLASIHSIHEYHDIQSLIMKTSYEYTEAWIGGSDAVEENHWFWSDGTSLHYDNWCPGEPNNHHVGQHCMLMNHSAEKCWDDFNCSAKRASVCVKKV